MSLNNRIGKVTGQIFQKLTLLKTFQQVFRQLPVSTGRPPESTGHSPDGIGITANLQE
jgi:hypothetical protein